MTPPTPRPSQRLVSLDAFRGGVMLLMASSGLGIPKIAASFPDNSLWQFIGKQCEHASWAGCTLWDMIQPSFMFMVGVAVPWSIASRSAKGESPGQMFIHALIRSAVLILLAVFLSSAWSKQTEWTFNNVLAQIGLGYPILFLAALRMKPRGQWILAGGILLMSWLAFAIHPVPPADFDWKSVGVPADWVHLEGFARHWEKNFNAAASFDVWFLNLFPRSEPFVFSSGGYQTLNFVPSMATMLFGLLTGQLLRSESSDSSKLLRMMIFGAAGIIVGMVISTATQCPIIKRIWTPSWAVFSSGVAVLCLAFFYWVVEIKAAKRWAFPLIVAGLNPIALYCLWQLSGGFIRESIKTHLGQHVFEMAGVIYAPMLERVAVLSVFWLILWWMHRRRLYLRV